MVIDQVLCVLCGGNRGAGGGGGRGAVMAVAVSVEALLLVLEEAVPQDGYHHHDAGGQEHRNGHFRGAWGKTGQNRAPGTGSVLTPTPHSVSRGPSQMDARCGRTCST